MKAEVSPSVGGLQPRAWVGVKGRTHRLQADPRRPGAGPRPNTMPTILKCIYTFLLKRVTHFIFKKSKGENNELVFYLCVCRIHNSNLSENILLCIQNNMGSQVTRQLRLCYNRVLLAVAEAHSLKLIGQHQLVPRSDNINIK